MNTCGNCVHARPMPLQHPEDTSMTCFHSPPMAVVVMAPQRPTIDNPRGGMGSQINMMYPKVVEQFPACGQFTEKQTGDRSSIALN